MRPNPTSGPAASAACCASQRGRTARAGYRHFLPLSALRAHTEALYKTDLLWETLRAGKRPGRAQTDVEVLPRELPRRVRRRQEGARSL